MNAKLAKRYRKAIGGITGVAKAYLSTKQNTKSKYMTAYQVIVDPNSNHGIYKRVKKARLTRKHLSNSLQTVIDTYRIDNEALRVSDIIKEAV